MHVEFGNSFKKFYKTGNFWCDLYPTTKLILCFTVAMSTIVMNNWIYGFSVCLFYFIFAFFTGHGKQFTKTFLILFVIIGLFLVVIRQVGMRTGNVTPMFEIFGWIWYRESFITSLDVSSYMLGFAGGILLFFDTTPMRDLMYAFEHMGVSHVTSFIMLSSMQNIIDLRKTSVAILESQKSRGIETDGNILVRSKAFFPTISPLILGAFSSTEEKSIAMDARAFSVKRKHTFLRELKPMSQIEKILCLLFSLALISLTVWKIAAALIK
ncbi:MAG: energy-coupling factor transporter transmembrane protein EcfT [Ruminococcaceae bacterium]|nr:energy-coupling factor transporter transmembrane protein EcfT [Oscillospiraceae bacterium]